MVCMCIGIWQHVEGDTFVIHWQLSITMETIIALRYVCSVGRRVIPPGYRGREACHTPRA